MKSFIVIFQDFKFYFLIPMVAFQFDSYYKWKHQFGLVSIILIFNSSFKINLMKTHNYLIILKFELNTKNIKKKL